MRFSLPSINRPRSIYQYSSMTPRLSGQNCKFFKFLLSSNSQKRLRYKENNTKYRSLTRKPRSHVRILIYRTWPIVLWLLPASDYYRTRSKEIAVHSSDNEAVLGSSRKLGGDTEHLIDGSEKTHLSVDL